VAFPANFELFWNERRERLERELEHVANLAERQQLPAEIREGALTSAPSLRLVWQRCCEFWLGARRGEGEYPHWSLTDEQQSILPNPRSPSRVGAAPAPRRVAGSLNSTSAIRLASALRVIRRRSQAAIRASDFGASSIFVILDRITPTGATEKVFIQHRW
jgi:hypothetical protein